MQEFLQRHAAKVMGIMSGFDRLWFRGTLRLIANVAGLTSYLNYRRGGGMLLKDFGTWSEGLTERIKEAGREVMKAAGRPVIYLRKPSVSKEELARDLAARDRIKTGPVCLLEAVEPCWTYELHRDRARRRLELQAKAGKCLQQYAYWIDEQVGWCHVRVQTWLPLDVRVSLNGREWLCRALAAEGIKHLRQDNCLRWVADLARAQELLTAQLQTPWPARLGELVARANPALSAVLLLEGQPVERYWSLEQSEWATDVLFKHATELDRLYPVLARQALLALGSQDVMRFLGAPVSVQGKIPANFRKEVVSDLKVRAEGMRIKHRVGNNSVKLYNKQGSVLRTETTIHDPRGLRVYRGTEQNPQDQKWRACRKGVADLHRVAQLADAANQRYLSYLAKVECPDKLGETLAPLCQRVEFRGRRYRGLRPLEAQDDQLLLAVGRGEWVISGFTNRQLREVLHGSAGPDHQENRRLAARTSRQLALLRAHALVKRLGTSRRWVLTNKGRQIVTLLSAAKEASAKDLLKQAA